MAEIRYNPLLGTWTMVCAKRQHRPQMPKDWCPFCPGSGKVPLQYDVLQYDNDFPVLSDNPPEPDNTGSDFYKTAPAKGACEVILYSSDHSKVLHELPVSHIRMLVDLWAERTNELSKNTSNKYIMPFENKGEEIGVTMPHPHGQIYAYSWIPQKLEIELSNARAHHEQTGECIICRMNKEEQAFAQHTPRQQRIVSENESFLAYVPFFTDYPYGVFIVPKTHRNYLSELTDQERSDLASILKIITGSFDKVFDRPFPYMMVIHQNPVNSPQWNDTLDSYHLHIEFYTPLRSKNLIKYYASSESGAWAAANVAAVENSAAEVRRAKLSYLAHEDPALFKRDFTKEFSALYGYDDGVEVYASPARVNLIGEHIDYNGGRVFPAAIDSYLYLAFRKRDDSQITYNDLKFPNEFKSTITGPFAYRKEDEWANFLNGALHILAERGYIPDQGFDLLIFGNIPSGGGLSSSAALEVGFTYAICDLYGFPIDRIDIAKIGQLSEHEFMNVHCGIMDQFAVSMGKKDHAIVLNTETLEYTHAPLQLGKYRIVVMNTNKKRALADSKYNERRSECEQALALIKQHKPVQSLCALSSDDLPLVKDAVQNETLFRRARHCITENERVSSALTALQAGDIASFGRFLGESHCSLRDDYDVTGTELDTLYEEAIAHQGCIGARMTGAGFGGCAIALVQEESIKDFITQVGNSYRERTGLEGSFFACRAGDGTHKM
ncbi:MAG: galactokinase [Spirochaetales bacterium]|nr:galactokinase [Spirochaetales bacterium]